MPTTVVTMFFALRDFPDATPSVRPTEFYLDKGRATLALPYPMVIFCDENTKPLIEPLRPAGLDTTYVVRKLTDYEFFQTLWPVIRKNRETMESPDPRNTSSYFLLCVFKFIAMKIAKDVSPADTYAWIDFGGSHVLRDFDGAARRMLDRPRPKFACCLIRYRSEHEMYPIKEKWGLAGECGIGGTAFTIESDYVEKVCFHIMSLLYKHVAIGVGHADEQLITYLWREQPDLFSLYYGDYQSILTNYHETVTDHISVWNNIIHIASANGDHTLASHIVSTLTDKFIDSSS